MWDNLEGASDSRSFRKSTNYSIQLEKYLKDIILLYYDDPLQKCWDQNKAKRYPNLIPCVNKYFGIPLSSSYSKRVFSIAENNLNLKEANSPQNMSIN